MAEPKFRLEPELEAFFSRSMDWVRVACPEIITSTNQWVFLLVRYYDLPPASRDPALYRELGGFAVRFLQRISSAFALFNADQAIEQYSTVCLGLPECYRPKRALRTAGSDPWAYHPFVWSSLRDGRWITARNPYAYIAGVSVLLAKRRQAEDEAEHSRAKEAGGRLVTLREDADDVIETIPVEFDPQEALHEVETVFKSISELRAAVADDWEVLSVLEGQQQGLTIAEVARREGWHPRRRKRIERRKQRFILKLQRTDTYLDTHGPRRPNDMLSDANFTVYKERFYCGSMVWSHRKMQTPEEKRK